MRKLLVLVVVLMAAVAATGCTAPPEKSVANFLDAIINSDYLTATKYAEVPADINKALDNPENAIALQAIEAVFSKVTYQIKDKKVNANAATVNAIIIAPDMAVISTRVMLDIWSSALLLAISGKGSDEHMNNLMVQSLMKQLSDTHVPMLTSAVQVNLVKRNRKWVIVVDDALMNAVSGNLEKGLDELKAK